MTEVMPAVGSNPVVRRNLRYVRQDKDGTPSYVVKDPVTLRYFRFGALEVWLMQSMDGTRSCAQLAAELREEHGVNASPAAIATLVRRLRELGIAQRDPQERSALVLESIRQQHRVRLHGNKNTLLRMRISFGDPDRLFDRMVGVLPFFWTRGFVLASLAVFAVYTLVLAQQWTSFVAGTALLYDPAYYTPQLLLTIYLLGVGIFLVHEFGHGLTCKRFGGEVHEMGAMLLYFSPAFYCNVNDAWTFEKRAHRLWVTFAGGWIQLWLAALAAFVWVVTEPGTAVHRIAFLATLIGGGYSVLINFNPLIPLDGYYALLDWLELPNLRQRSFAYLGAILKRHVLRMDTPIPAVTPRERRIFLRYSIAAIAYITLMLTLVLLWIGSLLVRQLGGWGWALLAFLLWRITRKPTHAVTRLARVWWAEHRPSLRVLRWLQGGTALTTALVLALIFVPWTVHTDAMAVVEPFERGWVRAPQSARLIQLHTREGARVDAGDTLLVLVDPELLLAQRTAHAELAALEREIADAHARNDAVALHFANTSVTNARAQVALLDRRVTALTLRAPFSAVVASPRLEQHLGERFAAGDTILELWRDDGLRARLFIPQREAGGVRAQSALRIRFAALPSYTWHARVQRTEPVATNGIVQAVVPLGLAAALPVTLRPGMTGRARIAVARTTLGRALLRGARRLVRLELML